MLFHRGTGRATARRRFKRYAHVDRGGRRTAVTENVAYHLDIGSGINLSACVTVPKRMGPNQFGRLRRSAEMIQ